LRVEGSWFEALGHYLQIWLHSGNGKWCKVQGMPWISEIIWNLLR
jgi:hypothetical protein